MCTLSYECTHTICMNIFKRLNRLNIKIHEVSHQECFSVVKDVTFH
jgi:hypothetical protein